MSVAVGKLVGVSVDAGVLVTLGFSVGEGTTVATLLAIVVGALAVGTAGCGVELAIGGTRLGAGVAVAGAGVSFIVVCVMSITPWVAGGSPAIGVRLAVGAAGLGDGVGDTVGVGEPLAGASGARMATGTTPGSIGATLLSRSAASAAWGLGGGISGIAPISQA